MSGPAESPDPAPAAPPSPATSSRAGDPGAAASAAAAGAAAAGAAARTAAAADGGGSPGADGSPVEAYLDRIFDLLAGTGAAGRRALAEVEDHLRAATDESVASGLSRVDAERAAVERFGTAEDVAAGLAPLGGVGLRRLAPQLVAAGALVAALGLLAVGVSGLVAEGLGHLFGWAFVAGDPPGVTYTPERCADFLEYFPNAGSCTQAAIDHHFGEVVEYRVAAGLLGLLGLGGLWVLRRMPRFRSPRWTPPPRMVAGLGALAAGASGVVLLADGTLMLGGLGADHGAGNPLSAGVVALLVAVGFAVALLRTRRAAPT